MLRIAGVILLFILILSPTYAKNDNYDVVYLIDGSEVRGIIISFVSNQELSIKTHQGELLTFRMDEVLRVSRRQQKRSRPQYPVEASPAYDVVYLTDGSEVRGIIISFVSNQELSIKTRQGELLTFRMDEVLRVSRRQQKRSRPQYPVEAPPMMGYPGVIPYKSPGVALLLSLFIPGAGQFYNEEPSKGAGMLIVGIASGALIVVATEDNIGDRDLDDDDAMGGLGAVIYLGTAIVSMAEAYSSADRINREMYRKSLNVRPITSQDRLGAIVTLRF